MIYVKLQPGMSFEELAEECRCYSNGLLGSHCPIGSSNSTNDYFRCPFNKLCSVITEDDWKSISEEILDD